MFLSLDGACCLSSNPSIVFTSSRFLSALRFVKGNSQWRLLGKEREEEDQEKSQTREIRVALEAVEQVLDYLVSSSQISRSIQYTLLVPCIDLLNQALNNKIPILSLMSFPLLHLNQKLIHEIPWSLLTVMMTVLCQIFHPLP